jgi:hypothetical protein
VVECLHGKFEALSSNTSTAKNKRRDLNNVIGKFSDIKYGFECSPSYLGV